MNIDCDIIYNVCVCVRSKIMKCVFAVKIKLCYSLYLEGHPESHMVKS